MNRDIIEKMSKSIRYQLRIKYLKMDRVPVSDWPEELQEYANDNYQNQIIKGG